MLELAARAGLKKVYLHAFLDGRDTPPRSARDLPAPAAGKVRPAQEWAKSPRSSAATTPWTATSAGCASRPAYDLLTQGKAEFQAETAEAALAAAYARDENDEFVKATAIVPPGAQPVRMEDGDVVVFMNFRSDRAREITRAFIEPGFDLFEREHVPQLATYCTLTEYSEDFNVPVAFPPEQHQQRLRRIHLEPGPEAARIAETEKYAHVTFFFNGGEERVYPGRRPRPGAFAGRSHLRSEAGNERIRGHRQTGGSHREPQVRRHHLQLRQRRHGRPYRRCPAAVKAIETLDQCLHRVVEAMQRNGGEVLITADHGNAEMMADENPHQAHTAHTLNLVPFVYVGRKAHLAETGALEDVAPTLLKMMGLQQPAEMTGHPLIEFE